MRHPSPRRWLRVSEISELVHRAPSTVHKLVAPYRQRCLLATHGDHPRLHLYVPVAVARLIYEKVYEVKLAARVFDEVVFGMRLTNARARSVSRIL